MILILTTCPEKDFKKVSNTIIKEKLAGCALKIKVSESDYWWEKKICMEKNEILLIFKTTDKLKNKLLKRLKEIHPYKIPFISQIKHHDVNEEYEKWLSKVTGD